MLVISHDPGVAAEVAYRFAVMYAANIVQQGPVRDVLRHPAHPYPQGLLASVTRAGGVEIAAFPGSPPDLLWPPRGVPSCRVTITAQYRSLPEVTRAVSGRANAVRRSAVGRATPA